MTMGPHVDPEALGGIEELPDSHPDRRHVERCARCRAALAAYRAFLKPPEELAASDLAAARARLRAARGAGAAHRDGGVKEVPAAGRTRWWTWPAWKPALAASAAVVVVAVLYIANADHFRGRGAVHLRGSEPGESSATAGSTPEIVQVTRDRGGAFHLRWRAVAGADGYRVTFFSAGLKVMARHEAGRDTSLTLPARDVASGAAGALYCQVTALRDSEETAASAMVPVDAR